MSKPAHRRGAAVRALAAAAVAAVTLLAGLALPAPSAAAEPTSIRVIVELYGQPALAELAGARGELTLQAATDRAAQRAETLTRDHQELLEQARADGVTATLVHDLTAAYNGLVLETSPTQVAALAELPGVRSVHPDTTFAAALDHSGQLIGAPEVWQRTDPAGEPVTGAGMTVAILDTGVDYRHPDLGGGFGPGHKVVAGHDFVNGDTDPMDDNGHGTHVAGIVAADGAVRGVAPDARLTAYKVLGEDGSGQVSDILAGLDAAVSPANPYRADVVNLSLSGPGDGTDPLSLAASLVARTGVVVVASAGNVGPAPQSVRSPAVADGVLAVGATTSGVWVPRARLVAPLERDLRAVRLDFSAYPATDPLRLAVVDVGEGRPGDYEDVDVTGKAVLIGGPMGQAAERALLAEQRGAAAALFYEPEHWGVVPEADQTTPLGAREPRVDAFRTGLDDGRLDRLVALDIPGASAEAVSRELASGPVTVEITVVDATDQLANFSSRGPGGLYQPKPELTAPGVEVLSTLPGGGHGRGSGTSMAAPHAAAAAALLRQLHPEWTSQQVTAALTASAHRLTDPAPTEQGAGRLDAANAADTTVLPTPHTVSFGLADASDGPVTRTRKLALTNHGDTPVRLALSVDQHGDGGTVTVTPQRAILTPGEAVEVTLRASLPAVVADHDLTGWLTVEVSGAPTLTVPYLLAARRLGLHVTPDPAPAGGQTTVYVRSPAELAAAPQLSLTCPGLDPRRVTAEPAGTRLWRAILPVGTAGLCEVHAAATADRRYGSTRLTGTVQFETVAPPSAGPADWQSVGPDAQAGWLAFGASTDRVAVIPTGSPSVFVSDDRMRTWQELRTMPMAGGTPIAVAVHPRHSDTMFVAVNGGGGVDPSYRGRVLYTTDSGRSWKILPGPDMFIRDLALDPTGTVLAVADDDSLRITSDVGATWSERPATWSGLRDLHWIGQDLYLGADEGLLRIRDAARPGPMEPEVLFRPELRGWADQVAGDADTLLVTSVDAARIYASYDGGKTFKEVFRNAGTRFLALELVGDEIYATQASGLWVGSQRGASWDFWGDPLKYSVEFDVATWAGDPGTVYVAASNAGVYAVDRPDDFTRVGVPGARVFSLATAVGSTGEHLIAGTEIDSFHTTLPSGQAPGVGPLEWHSSGGEGFPGAHARLLAVAPSNPSVVYKARMDDFLTFGIYRSNDGGATWRRLASPTAAPFAMMVHPADPDRVYVSYLSLTSGGLVITTDGGKTWEKVDHGRVFEALAGDPTDPDRLWAGDREGLYLSQDGGLTFERLAEGWFTAIGVDPADPAHLVLGGRGLFVSHDGGRTVAPADHVALDMWVADIEFARDGRVFAATTAFVDELGVLRGGRGVLSSGDGGATWESYNWGLSNRDATSLAFSGDGRHLYVGTLGGSVHRIELR